MAFCHLLKNLEINIVKKLWILEQNQKRDLEIIDERTSAGKSKNTGKEEDNKVNKMQEIEIPLEKRLQIIDDLRLY